jgi:predicted esterase
VIQRTIAASTHGRYLVLPPARTDPVLMLAGFHGYAEGAEAQLDRLRAIPGSDRSLLVSIQGLHRFYRPRTNEIIASWMTRQDRELAIADNLAYVAAVVDALSREWATVSRLVFAGFSQGVSMAFRAAAASSRRVDGVIAVGGDVPPELESGPLAGVPSMLICRGARDEFYAPATYANDLRRLREAGVAVTALEFDGGHEWSGQVLEAAAVFLVTAEA